MSTKKTRSAWDNQRPNNVQTCSNGSSDSTMNLKQNAVSLDQLKCDLQKYFFDHVSTIDQYCKTKDFIDKQTFESILRSSGLFMKNTDLDSLWNSCQPSDQGICYKQFLQCFVPSKSENNPTDTMLSSSQCRILNYVTRLGHVVRNNWQNLKNEFSSLDRYGRLFITIDQAINLMRKYSFPFNDNQQCELALLFSPKRNGQFNYFDFLHYFTDQTSSIDRNQSMFSRSTHRIQSKQSWTSQSINMDGIFDRIRSQCLSNHQSIYRMFRIFDKNRQNYLTKTQFNHLLNEFDIYLNEEELYHMISEIDKNQDGVISYDELYDSLITDALQM